MDHQVTCELSGRAYKKNLNITFSQLKLLLLLLLLVCHVLNLIYIIYLRIEKNRSHHPVGQRSVFKLSAVLPTMTYGGSTRVLINMIRPTTAIISPSLFNRSLSVIFTTFADLTLNITDILRTRI